MLAANSSHTCSSAILPTVTAPAAHSAATAVAPASSPSSGSAAFQSPCVARVGNAPLAARAPRPTTSIPIDVVAHDRRTSSRPTRASAGASSVVIASSSTASARSSSREVFFRPRRASTTTARLGDARAFARRARGATARVGDETIDIARARVRMDIAASASSSRDAR